MFVAWPVLGNVPRQSGSVPRAAVVRLDVVRRVARALRDAARLALPAARRRERVAVSDVGTRVDRAVAAVERRKPQLL